jgi:hypothetical protein
MMFKIEKIIVISDELLDENFGHGVSLVIIGQKMVVEEESWRRELKKRAEEESWRRELKKRAEEESWRRELKKRAEDSHQLGNHNNLILDFIEICSVLGWTSFGGSGSSFCITPISDCCNCNWCRPSGRASMTMAPGKILFMNPVPNVILFLRRGDQGYWFNVPYSVSYRRLKVIGSSVLKRRRTMIITKLKVLPSGWEGFL